ncbi:unnamed protein product [Mucor hiemalis]
MTPLAQYYGKIFGVGLALGGGMEVMLIKTFLTFVLNQMLAASEAKQKLKERTQEQEDEERLQRIKANTSST